jgi:hypothetical protein
VIVQTVVATNILDLVCHFFQLAALTSTSAFRVDWPKDRYEDIYGQLKTFLVQSGSELPKTHFVAVGVMSGVNLSRREGQDAVALNTC